MMPSIYDNIYFKASNLGKSVGKVNQKAPGAEFIIANKYIYFQVFN